jgi:predicted RNase H-like HicB family nuclease
MSIAFHPELEGCIAQGETPEEAKRNLDILRVEWIESLLEDGLEVPEPFTAMESGLWIEPLNAPTMRNVSRV